MNAEERNDTTARPVGSDRLREAAEAVRDLLAPIARADRRRDQRWGGWYARGRQQLAEAHDRLDAALREDGTGRVNGGFAPRAA